ncbi:MAG: translation initiation factor IF-2 [Bacteriovoracaceae bacterium]|nr:translation initiation factor IF-2 [Bacteriovoracaceae bacterium]
MTQKVFELAKEFNLSAIDLVEKLRSGGLNVRNHMVTLTEDELNVAMNILRPPTDAKKDVKKVIKKAVKKVATSAAPAPDKKTSASSDKTTSSASTIFKESESSEKENSAKVAASAAAAKGKKVVTVKRRTKSDKEEMLLRESQGNVEEEVYEENTEYHEELVDEAQASDHLTDEDSTSEIVVSKTERPAADLSNRYLGDRQKGLEIISRPQRPAAPSITAKGTAAAGSETGSGASSPDDVKKKTIFREKMHTFTPVFVPEAKADSKNTNPEDAKSRLLSKPSKVTFETTEEVVDEDADAKGDKSKKRFGDLAAIVSKKTVDKNIDLNFLRAEEELKFASTIVGAGVYTPPKRKKIWTGERKNTLITEVKDSKRVVIIHGSCTASDLAQKLSVKFEALADECLKLNLLLAESDDLGPTLATQIAGLYQYRVEDRAFDESKIIQVNQLSEQEEEDDELEEGEKITTSDKANKNKSKEAASSKKSASTGDEFPLRNPIIAIMGHVDHGKTSLLDFIRKEKVADSEAGGITQHIGAYSVKVKEATLTFLDTPGHAAFASMRQRGANVTDIVVLVVAADDGVMPQTIESIRYIQNAKSPMIVAINKIDKEGAKPEKIKQDLMQYGITPEEWGGDTQFIEVSATKGTGIDKLLESIQVQAEVMELRENPKGAAECIVIESKLETGRGPVCTVIVKKGSLKKGDAIVCGECSGRARSLMDFVGKNVDIALPSMPVQILGLDSAPSPGDKLNVVANEREAKKIVENRINERKSMESAEKKVHSMEDFFKTETEGNEKKILNLIVRSDVQGSFEAIKSSLESQVNDEVSVKVISGGVGAITENDVMMADSVKGYVIGFNMRPVTSARKLAEDKGVEIKTYTIIYELIDDVKLALEGLLAPQRVETYIGRAQVKEVFNIPKIGVIAGSQVIDGKMERNCNIRLLRDGKIMHDGKLSSLKRFKDDAKEVKNGLECGISLDGYSDVKAGDIFEAYLMEEKKRKFEARPVTL